MLNNSFLLSSYNIAVHKLSSSQYMVMFKNDRALCVIRIPHYDMIIAVSESKFYARAANRLKLRPKATYEYVYDGTGFMIDVNSNDRITDKIVDFSLPVQESRFGREQSPWFSHFVG